MTINVSIPAMDRKAEELARKRWDSLTKPQGSLGRLEELGICLAGMTGSGCSTFARKVIFTVAADHGVASEGVSAFPSSVTAQMVFNFIQGGAGINVLARLVGSEVVVVDAGVAADVPLMDGLIQAKIRLGTANFLKEPAMSREEALQSIETGRRLFKEHHEKEPIGLMGLGDMGIGNTTSSAALTALFTGLPVAQVTGRGTGIEEERRLRKIHVIEEALHLHRPDPKDPIDCLAKVGGLEIGCLAGIALGAASHRVPVVLDGFITTAAALVAQGIAPEVKEYFIAAHQSMEPGHREALKFLGLVPLLDLQMRLGEGTGAALGIFLIEASRRLLTEMATFSEAGVSEKL